MTSFMIYLLFHRFYFVRFALRNTVFHHTWRWYLGFGAARHQINYNTIKDAVYHKRSSWNIEDNIVAPCWVLDKTWKRKGITHDSSLWQNPLYQQKIRKKKPIHNTASKNVPLLVYNDCGPTSDGQSVGVITVTILALWTCSLTNLPTPCTSYTIKRTYI